jgi:hypothetical protein
MLNDFLVLVWSDFIKIIYTQLTVVADALVHIDNVNSPNFEFNILGNIIW